MGPVEIKLQSAVLFVKDVAASRRFYEGLLGQKVSMDHGANVGFEGGFALWQGDYAHRTIHGREEANPAPMGRGNFELYFETDDLDAAWQRLPAAGVVVIHPVREQPWGQRVFRVADPDGHIVEVGEPMPAVLKRFAGQGLSAEEIAGRTFMPLEMVRLALGAV